MDGRSFIFEIAQFDVKSLICCRLKLLESASIQFVSTYQAQKVLCRNLLLTYPNVLVCPCIGDDELYFLLKRTEFENGKWIGKLKMFGIQVIGEDIIYDQLLASLIWYSVSVRLSPDWNRVDSYFVKGRDFLSSAGRYSQQAIEFKVHSRHNGVTKFLVTFREIRLHPASRSFVNENILRETVRTSIGTWCQVLPKMSKGLIISVRKEFPERCVFPDYSALQDYWKDLYGYCIPEDPTGLLFYEIYFKAIREEPFLYPSCCVMRQGVELLNECHQLDSKCRITIQQFVADLQAKVMQICDTPLVLLNAVPLQPSQRFSPSAKMPVSRNLSVDFPLDLFQVKKNDSCMSGIETPLKSEENYSDAEPLNVSCKSEDFMEIKFSSRLTSTPSGEPMAKRKLEMDFFDSSPSKENLQAKRRRTEIEGSET